MDRVADFESVGWGFESLVPRQIASENVAIPMVSDVFIYAFKGFQPIIW